MDTKAIGERIQIAREERCMTQLELAKKVGCTSQHISAIERGAKTPTFYQWGICYKKWQGRGGLTGTIVISRFLCAILFESQFYLVHNY